LFRHLALPGFEALLLQHEVVDLRIDLNIKVFHCFDDLRVGFFEQNDVVAVVFSVDHALRTHRGHVAVVAEVRNLFFWVLSAELAHLSVRLVHVLRVLLLGSLTAAAPRPSVCIGVPLQVVRPS